MYKKEPHTPPYWTKFDNSMSVKDWAVHYTSLDCKIDVDVDQPTLDAVKHLVADTWDGSFVGLGANAKGLNHCSLKVKKVQRIENVHLFEKYTQERQRLFKKAKFEGEMFHLESLPTSKGPVLTQQKIDKRLTSDIYPEINEHYFFHGTTDDRIQPILKQGFDTRLAKNGSFGSGVYTAESSTKADQYAGIYY
jgi:hypothetical protein